MLRSTYMLALLAMAAYVFPAHAQTGPPSIDTYFTGKEVKVKIDMPGSQKGVDLRFDKPVPMDWKEYSSRIKAFGPAIHKGDVARVTAIVVKKDRIEFQLDGGGFGTFGDDTSTTVAAKPVEKSDYEKNLEKQISVVSQFKKKRRKDCP